MVGGDGYPRLYKSVRSFSAAASSALLNDVNLPWWHKKNACILRMFYALVTFSFRYVGLISILTPPYMQMGNIYHNQWW